METYNALHAIPIARNEKTGSSFSELDDSHLEANQIEYLDDDMDETDADKEDHFHRYQSTKEKHESFDFNEQQSSIWNRYHMRRFYQDRGSFWTSSRTTTAWKWILVVWVGLLIAFTGAFVAIFTETLFAWKLDGCYKLMEERNFAGAFFAWQFFSTFLVLCAGAFCWWEPMAAGSGIPEIKAFLNGVNLNHVVRGPVLIAKVLGMCFSCSSGLPLGKEGPMIHAGSIIGAVISQGWNFSFGFDTSWNRFHGLRNDFTKRDFVTCGAAAGISAAFRAPIGGILFTLEEGASFWSTSLTFRAFICAVITQLTISLLFAQQSTDSAGMFAFGQFDTLVDGRANFYVYELPLFFAIGAMGGILGAGFNHINKLVSIYRKKHLNPYKWKRIVELVLITFAMSFISYILPMCWQVCTPIPEDPTGHFTVQETQLLTELVQFQCEPGEYNQLASLYFTSGDLAMRQLFHFREFNGEGANSFTFGPLILFFIPYFLLAAVTSGCFAPAGLFVPTLLSGAAFGRFFGHIFNSLFPGRVADSGTYALIGAAAVLGGMARMTIAGCVICLEACGNIAYLLPLMVTFAAARYVGNAINEPLYDTQIFLKDMPFLEGSLHSLGLLNFQSISEVMAQNVVTLYEIDKISTILHVLQTTNHNGFPIVNREGRLRGLILRKTLCGMLKYKAYSVPTGAPASDGSDGIEVIPASTVNYDTLERTYPKFPEISDIKLSDTEMVKSILPEIY